MKKQNNSLRASALQIIDTLVTAAKYICAVGLLICFGQTTWAQNPTPAPVDLNIVAHQDDDILFMNPDILNTVLIAGHRQVTVYITGGNIGLKDFDNGLGTDPQYVLDREEGAIAGYSKLLQLADAKKADASHFHDLDADANPPPAQTFTTGDSRAPVDCLSACFACAEHACELSTAGGAWVDGSGSDTRGQRGTMKIGLRKLNVATIGDGPDGPRVTLIFLRVDSTSTPDGRPDGAYNPPVSLYQLFTTPTRNGLPKIQSRFNQPGYTKQQLINQLVQILQLFQPDIVRTQDPADGHIVDYPNAEMIDDHGCPQTEPFRQDSYDHTDHVWGARFAREALKAYDRLPGVKLPTTYAVYMGYNVERNEDQNYRLTSSDFCLKKSIFYRYGLHDAAAVIVNPASGGFDCYSYIGIGYQQSLQPALP